MELLQTGKKHPVYIVEIQSTKLERWLSRVGIQVGDPVWNAADLRDIPSVWVEGPQGRVIIGSKMASMLLVKHTSGQICTLDLLPPGERGRFLTYKNCNGHKLFWKAGKIKKRALVHIKQRLNRFDFYIDTGQGTLRIDDETAYNIWARIGEKRVQLGAWFVGQPFSPDLYTGVGIKTAAIEHLMSKKIPFLTIKKIVRKPIESNSGVSVTLKNKSGNKITLKGDMIHKIKVRLCDICWSCNDCK